MVTVVAETAEGPGSNPCSVTCLFQVCYRINFLCGRRGFTCVLSKLWQATNHEFKGALRFATGTCAGGWPGWPGMPRTLVSCKQPTLPYIGWRGHTRLTTLRLSVNQPTSGCTVVAGQYNQYSNCSPPSAPLILTRPVNLGHQTSRPRIHCLNTPHTLPYVPQGLCIGLALSSLSVGVSKYRGPPLKEQNKNGVRKILGFTCIRAAKLKYFYSKLCLHSADDGAATWLTYGS